MASYQCQLSGDFQQIMNEIHNAVMNGSVSASYENFSRYEKDGFQCEVRVYERFSWTGGNRLSMTIMLVGKDGEYQFSAITAGGSQAVFFKINTIGEESFLNTILNVLKKFRNDKF